MRNLCCLCGLFNAYSNLVVKRADVLLIPFLVGGNRYLNLRRHLGIALGTLFWCWRDLCHPAWQLGFGGNLYIASGVSPPHWQPWRGLGVR